MLLSPGVTVSPVIIASDKTQLSNHCSDQAAWPVYLSIINLLKETCCQVSAHATVLIGYLLCAKLCCYLKKACPAGRWKPWHHCIEHILCPLVKARLDGVEMLCSDGHICKVHSIIAVYIGNYPKQCLITGVSTCPKGTVSNSFGAYAECSPQDLFETLQLMKQHQASETPPEFEEQGLCLIYNLSWEDLLYCNIYTAITSNLLYQIHKGIFKDHLVEWEKNIVSKTELDQCFKAVPHTPGLKHFTYRISTVKQ